MDPIRTFAIRSCVLALLVTICANGAMATPPLPMVSVRVTWDGEAIVAESSTFFESTQVFSLVVLRGASPTHETTVALSQGAPVLVRVPLTLQQQREEVRVELRHPGEPGFVVAATGLLWLVRGNEGSYREETAEERDLLLHEAADRRRSDELSRRKEMLRRHIMRIRAEGRVPVKHCSPATPTQVLWNELIEEDGGGDPPCPESSSQGN